MALKSADEFEGRLRHIDWLALAGSLIHKATVWLGTGAVTWSTVVLMGGFASAVPISDFKLITLLVVLIVFLLALSLFSVKFITKKTISTGSIDPVHYTYHDKRPRIVTLFETLSLLCQLTLISYCLIEACTNIRRPDFQSMNMNIFFHNTPPARTPTPTPTAALQACLETCFSAANYNSPATMAAICAQACVASATESNNNLQVCLFSFFFLVIATAFSAALCLIYRWIVKPLLWMFLVGYRDCLSLRRYHDEVLSRALNLGFAEGDEFDSREFLLRALGEDLMMRNIAPLEVRRMNLAVIEYLYNHPKGPEMVYQGLASEDTLLQQAAANIVGFWAESNMRLDGQLELLSRLGTKLGLPGKAAEGAANSFRAVADKWSTQTDKEPSPLLSVRVARSGVAAGGGAAVQGRGALPADGAAAGVGDALPGGGSSTAPDGTAMEGGAERGGDAVLGTGTGAWGGDALPGGGSSTAPGGGDDLPGGGSSTAPDGAAMAGGAERGGDAVLGTCTGAGGGDALPGGGSSTAPDGAAMAGGAERGGDAMLANGAAAGGGDAAPAHGASVTGGAEGERAAVLADGAATGAGAAVEGAVVPGGGALPRADGLAEGEGDAVRADVAAAAGQGVAGGEGEGAAGGGGAGPGADGYNVVDRVVDLLLQKRAPTLLVYVRALESFLRSASIRQHVSLTGSQARLEEKLKDIIRKSGSRMEPRTKLIALFALCRLKSSDGVQIEQEHRESMEELLTTVDGQFTRHLANVDGGEKVLWVTEKDQYEELCAQLRARGIRVGGWLTRCIINGADLVALAP